MTVTARQDVAERLAEAILGLRSFREDMARLGWGDDAARALACEVASMQNTAALWQRVTGCFQQLRANPLPGPILDVGCGWGNFVFHGLLHGRDAWGVDITKDKIAFHRLRVALSGAPAAWKDRCVLADAEAMPFPSNTFAAAASYMVLEHLPRVGEALRETVRVVRPGGLLYLAAQDARISWEGHYRIPWLPFMPEHLARTWLEEFGRPVCFPRGVYYVTTPQVAAVLEACGCQVVYQAPAPDTIVGGHWQIQTRDQVRAAAREARRLHEAGRWPRQLSGLLVVAVKR